MTRWSAGEAGQSGGLGHRLRDRVGLALGGRNESSGEQVVEEPQRDEVQHDRRDDLVRTGRGPQDAGDAAPDRPADERRDEQTHHDVDRSGQVERDRHARWPAVAPTMSWPLPPMLNSPPLNANATDRPAKINGVDSGERLGDGALRLPTAPRNSAW